LGGGAQDIWIELDSSEVLSWALHGSNILKIYQEGYNLVFGFSTKPKWQTSKGQYFLYFRANVTKIFKM